MSGRSMRIVLVLVLSVLTAGIASSSAVATAQVAPTPAAVMAQFKKATGRSLIFDKLHGAYTVADSVTNRSLFGTFRIYVVPGGDEADVNSLLINTHTGELGVPGPSNIYWEPGRYLSGTPYYIGKKRYGTSVVLWWYGDQQKIDKRFKRLHKALLPFAAS